MNKFPSSNKNLKCYETVVIVQSFPILTHVMNNIENLKKPLCIIVSFNRDVSKFVTTVLSNDVDIFSFGYGVLLRKSVLAPLRKYYIKTAHAQGRKISTNKLIMTCLNWCDVSAIYLDAIKFDNLSIWVPYEEKRYSFKSEKNGELRSYHNYINKITSGLIEKKSFFSQNGKVRGNTIGLVTDHPKLESAEIEAVSQVKKVVSAHKKAFSIGQDYILFVERELIRTGQISLINYLRILNSLRKLSVNSGLKVYVKFKPRHYYLLKHLLFKIFGISAMPVWVPAQYYCYNKECKIILGFTSSALSINYEKPFYSLATLKRIFKNDLSQNVESMIERAQSQSVNMNFLCELSDIELLEV